MLPFIGARRPAVDDGHCQNDQLDQEENLRRLAYADYATVREIIVAVGVFLLVVVVLFGISVVSVLTW